MYCWKVWFMVTLELGFVSFSNAVAPISITLMQDGSYVPPGATVEVISGVNSVFTCTAIAHSNPPPAIMTWKLDNQTIKHDTGYPRAVPNDDNPSLYDSIGQVTLTPTWSNHGDILECYADHAELTTPLRHYVTIDVKVSPSSDNTNLTDPATPGGYLPAESAIVNETNRAEFTCTVEGARPEAQISWYVGSDSPYDGEVHTVTRQNPREPLLTDTISTLTFEPRREDHFLDLKCVASIQVSGATPFTFAVKLVVHGSPDDPAISGDNEATEFDLHELTCDANNGLPAGQIIWFLGHTDITNSSVQTNTESPTFRINIKSVLTYDVRRGENGEDITCQVRHQNLQGPDFPHDTINMNVKFCPETAIFTQCPANIREGKTGQMTCRSGSSNPPAAFKWSTNGNLTDNPHDPTYTDGEYNGVVTTQEFTTRELTKRDLGINFKCCAVNEEASCGTNPCHTCQPEIYYPPTITDFQVPSNPFVESESVSLNCTVDANPNSEVVWERDSTVVGVDENVDRVSTLNLTIDREMAGNYQCKADNSYGDTAESERLPLTVHYDPRITSKYDDNWRPRPYDPVTIHCITVGNPVPVTRWEGPQGEIPVNGTDRFQPEEVINVDDKVRGSNITGYLTIVEFDPNVDDGVFTCTAENNFGKDVHDIRVEEARVPEVPLSVELQSELSTPSSLSLAWTPGDDGGRQQWNLVVYRINEENEEFGEEIEVRGDTKLDVTGLESNTEYEIAVMAENEIGKSDGQETVFGWTYPSSHSELGVDVTYNSKTGMASITGLPPDSTVCVQLEVSYDEGTSWTPVGDCYSSNVDHYIDENPNLALIRSAICGRESGLCGEFVLPAPTAVKDTVNLVIVLSATIVPICLILVVIIIIITLWRRRKNSNTESNLYDTPPDADVHNLQVLNNATMRSETNDYENTVVSEVYERPYPDVEEFKDLFNDERYTIQRNTIKLEKKIGAGHFAAVYKGKYSSKADKKDVTVAIKVLTVEDKPNRSEEATKKAIANMAKELKNTLRVTTERHNANSNIVHTYGWSFERTDAEKIFIVMEYLEGGTLHEFVEDKHTKGEQIEDTQYYQFASQIANGMEFLEHQEPPLIHRDLAARNVLLNSKENPTTCKVSDFGLARTVSDEEAIYQIETGGVELPTRWYAIESLLRKVFTTKSDVWSFGILLWEMTSGGALPYDALGIKSTDLLDALQRGTRLQPPFSMPEDMVPLMQSCWKADPEERPTFQDLKIQLEKGPNANKRASTRPPSRAPSTLLEMDPDTQPIPLIEPLL